MARNAPRASKPDPPTPGSGGGAEEAVAEDKGGSGDPGNGGAAGNANDGEGGGKPEAKPEGGGPATTIEDNGSGSGGGSGDGCGSGSGGGGASFEAGPPKMPRARGGGGRRRRSSAAAGGSAGGDGFSDEPHVAALAANGLPAWEVRGPSRLAVLLLPPSFDGGGSRDGRMVSSNVAHKKKKIPASVSPRRRVLLVRCRARGPQ